MSVLFENRHCSIFTMRRITIKGTLVLTLGGCDVQIVRFHVFVLASDGTKHRKETEKREEERGERCMLRAEWIHA